MVSGTLKIKIPKLVFKKHMLILILLLFPFIQQRSYREILTVLNFYKYAALLASAVIYYLVFVEVIKGKLNLRNKKAFVLILFFAVYVICALIDDRQTFAYVAYNAFCLSALSLLIFMEVKRNALELLQALSVIYGAFIFLNWLLYMLFPKGLYKTTVVSYHNAMLLGDDNAIIYVILPGLVCLACYSLLRHRTLKWYVWFEIIISEYTMLSLWAASAVIAMTLFIALLFFSVKVGRINARLLLAVVIAAIVLVLFGLTNPFVQSFIVDVLHKDATLTGRTVLWKAAFSMIAKKPLLGYGGFFTNGSFLLQGAKYPCHTPYLQILIDGGFTLFVFFAATVFFGYNEVAKNGRSLCGAVLAAGMTCMLINYITEYSGLFHFTIIIALMLNISYFPDAVKGVSFYGKQRRLIKR